MGLAGEHSTQFWRVMCLNILLVFGFTLSSCSSTANAASVTPTATSVPDNGNTSVIVKNDKGGLLKEGVVIGVNGTWLTDDYDEDGFKIDCYQGRYFTVWAPGYQIKTQPCNDNQVLYDIPLSPLIMGGGIYSSWISADGNCRNCHNGQINGLFNEYGEWGNSGHAIIFKERYLESMYTGRNILTNLVGEQTRWTINSNGKIRLRPENNASLVYTGPGFRLDYPNEYGNCAFCHVPAAVEPLQVNVDLLSFFPFPGGAVGEGVTCDICHKVVGVTLDDTGYPYSDQPGVLSLQFLPAQNDPYFSMGPFTHTTFQIGPSHGFDCSPVFSESRFCAACHYGKFNDMLIYNSYGEWLDSDYSKKEVNPEGTGVRENKDFRSCQDCHMLTEEQIGDTLPSQREACSAKNNQFGDFNHDFMKNRSGQSLIIDAASLDFKLEYGENKSSLRVIVKTTNEKAGHKLPTDSPLRHLILVVEARDDQGNLLPQISGETIPVWGGVGNKPEGMENYGGMAGKIYANLLVDKDTNFLPTAAYWNPTKHVLENMAEGITSDTRLPPKSTDESKYSFALPSLGDVKIIVKLVYRFAFIELAYLKGWNRSDILVTSQECTVKPTQTEILKCES